MHFRERWARDWFMLTICQLVWGYFVPRDYGITFIVRSYLHLMSSCFWRIFWFAFLFVCFFIFFVFVFVFSFFALSIFKARRRKVFWKQCHWLIFTEPKIYTRRTITALDRASFQLKTLFFHIITSIGYAFSTVMKKKLHPHSNGTFYIFFPRKLQQIEGTH